MVEELGKQQNLGLIALVGISLIMGYGLIYGKPFFIDEPHHYQLIEKISLGTVQKSDFWLATLPGYHYAVGYIVRLAGFVSVDLVRLVNLFISFGTVLTFFLIARRFDSKTTHVKTMQFLFFPIIFPFYFLVYTEMLSLLLILLTFYFLNRKTNFIAGIFSFGSVLVRQNNLIWLGFFLVLITVDFLQGKVTFSNVKRLIIKTSSFAASFMFMAIFAFHNKGLILGDKGVHPFSFYFDNLFVFLFLFFFLFLPLNISNLWKISHCPIRKLLPIAALVVAGFIFYFFQFKAEHHWNHILIEVFFRNQLLDYAMRSPLNKTLFYIPIGLSIVSLARVRYYSDLHYFYYPFTAVFLGMSLLVDPRYAIIPFTLMILLMKERSKLLLAVETIYLFVLTTLTYRGILNGSFFW